MGSFEDRLKKAIDRGTARAEARDEEARARAMTQEELKNLHGKFRLQLSDHIEECLGQLPSHFPGFRFETIFGDKGWGAACSRDDFAKGRGSRSNVYSRVELTVKPFSDLHVLELYAKGTVRNKEVFNRTHFKKLDEVDMEEFIHRVDTWVVEYAERYAATR